MKLTFLGSGACFYPALHNTSAYFVIDNNLILLDCGETVYERLLDSMDISQFEQIYVIITHLHADHVGSLGSLLSYCSCILKKRIFVIHPQDKICSLLSMMGIAESFYTYKAQLSDEIPGLHIVPVEVQHAMDMKCYGYEISWQNWCIYYSGDAAAIPEVILEKFYSGIVQEIYQDTASHESEHHMYLGELEQVIPQSHRSRVTCMHLDGNYSEELEKKGFCTIK